MSALLSIQNLFTLKINSSFKNKTRPSPPLSSNSVNEEMSDQLGGSSQPDLFEKKTKKPVVYLGQMNPSKPPTQLLHVEQPLTPPKAALTEASQRRSPSGMSYFLNNPNYERVLIVENSNRQLMLAVSFNN